MSKIIKIISNKIAKEHLSTGSRTSFIDYTNILSETAKNQTGFISSNSYWKNPLENHTDQKIEIISISEWKSIDDWNSWYNSESRQQINNKYSKIIDEEKFNVLLKKTPSDDIFLL